MEALNLNRIPVGSNPVVHVSQYDVGRVFRFNLFDGSNVYTLDGTETIECNIRKLDGNVVTVGVTNTSSDYIDVVTTEQMTAIHGQNYGEIVFKKGGNVIGSVNFILQVEQSPLEGGITSDSAIYNLEVQVANYVAIEVANQYDSANVIFDPSPVQGHGNGYTVTSEGIGTALDTKQDNITTKTASGSLIHISDGGDNIPMTSLISEIVAVESGNGQPKSPDNPYSISGFDSGVITRCGVNLCDEVFETGDISYSTGDNITGASWIRSTNYVPIVSGLTIYVKSAQNINMFFYDSNKAYLGYNIEYLNIKNTEITISSKARYFRIATKQTSYNNDISINYPSTDTDYHAYNGNTYTFTFGQTVYGGHFDNKGNLVVTHNVIDLGTITFGDAGNNIFGGKIIGMKQPQTPSDRNKGILCSNYPVSVVTQINQNMDDKSILRNSDNIYIRNTDYNTASDFQNSINGVMLVYELATPITLAITSQDIPTLLGVNNIFSNCGDLDIEYFSNTVDGLVTLINDFTVKNATELPISDSDPTDTKSYIDTGLSGKADTSDLNDKQNKNVLNIVKHYDTGTSSDAITDIITEYGKVNMVFAFDVPLGYFTGCLTFANDNMGSGFIVLSTTGRFWVVSYVSGTITLTELT